MGLASKLDWAMGLKRKFRAAQAQSGKSVATQIGEIWRLYREAEHFGIDDYFDYRVYANDWRGEQAAVAGWRMLYWLDDCLNPKPWRNVVYDKLAMYSVMLASGLPIPNNVAVFQRHGRSFQGARNYTEPAELAAALRGDFPYPCFVKPVYGDVGAGALAIARYDAASDSLVLTNGETRPVDGFIASLAERRQFVQPIYGHLFQELMNQHASLVPVSGPRIASVRIVVLMHDEGPQPISASWKIIVGNNMGDNYDHGRSGNLWAAVELATGQVERVVHGHGVDQVRYTHHPESGIPLIGLQLPDWKEAMALVMRGAHAFPMLRFQHWDVALTDQGPRILEVNVTGGIDIVQYAAGKGLYDQTLRAFVAKYGLLKGKAPSPLVPGLVPAGS